MEVELKKVVKKLCLSKFSDGRSNSWARGKSAWHQVKTKETTQAKRGLGEGSRIGGNFLLSRTGFGNERMKCGSGKTGIQYFCMSLMTSTPAATRTWREFSKILHLEHCMVTCTTGYFMMLN